MFIIDSIIKNNRTMNEIIKLMNSRKSDRVFSGEAVKQEDLDLILRTVQRAPTSIGAQQISLVVVEDTDTIQKIAELLADSHKWLVLISLSVS